MTTLSRWACAPVLAALTALLLAGCGGGGGGGGGSSMTGGSTGGGGTTGGNSNPVASNATISGTLQDKSSGILLSNRTVTVQGTGLSAKTDGNGAFAIANVPVSTITLIIVDASGVSNGSYSVDISQIGGNPRNLGTIALNVSGSGAPPGAPVIM